MFVVIIAINERLFARALGGGRSVSLRFGIVGMLAGACGVPAGAALAQRLRARLPHCDPLVCGLALLASAPLVYLALVAVSSPALTTPTYILMFLGMFSLNLTWSIVADIVLVSCPLPRQLTELKLFQWELPYS